MLEYTIIGVRTIQYRHTGEPLRRVYEDAQDSSLASYIVMTFEPNIISKKKFKQFFNLHLLIRFLKKKIECCEGWLN